MISRRTFLREASLIAVGAAAGTAREASAEPPPETTTLRLHRNPPLGVGVCIAPQFVAEELLEAEGFTDVRYAATGRVSANRAVAAGEIDLSTGFVGNWIIHVAAGDPVVMLTGVHVGCYELFASERIRTVRELKGKTVGVTELGSGRHVFLVSSMAYVGMNPNTDVTFITRSPAECMELFAAGKIDAYQAFAEEVQELRTRKLGHSILSSTGDRPWSQYFCCMVAGNRDFVRKHPVATKRAVRAILKASAVCALEPERATRFLMSRGYTKQYEYALQTLKSLPYTKWNQYDPEDTIRFYAVRLHEVGMIGSSPQKILAQGTDWRFLNELRKELKG